ncbi:MAG: hypothetical protein P1V51_03410 [Deltaproteobacteria bacterium]|nr:hypothetical protein [Deltaproteobacteria bacterium]
MTPTREDLQMTQAAIRAATREDLSYSAPVSDPEQLETSPDGGLEDDAELAAAARAFKRGQGHTYLYLIALCGGLMLASPVLNRFLEAFQGVVVDLPPDGPAVILDHTGMIIERRVSDGYRQSLSVGQYLRKVEAEWNPRLIEASELEERTDVEEAGLQPRTFLPSRMALYLEEWTGTVYAIRNQQLPTTGNGMGEVGERTTLELQLDGGGTKSLTLSEELRTELAGKVAVGARLSKMARRWEPVVLPRGAVAPPPPPAPGAPASPAPAGDSAPPPPEAAAPSPPAPAADAPPPPSPE